MKRIATIALSAGFGGLALAGAFAWPWNGIDLAVFMAAGHHWPQPYIVEGFRYSPALAALMAVVPLNLVVWDAAGVLALALAIRGVATPLLICLMAPWIMFDLTVGNVTTLAMALMIALLRWPSVRTAVAYAVFVVLVPKPAFLPVLLYAFVTLPEARRALLAVGAVGVAMLAFPGYLGALLTGNHIFAGLFSWFMPTPLALALVGCGAVLTVAALRWPRLLGPAAILVSGYWWGYVFAPLGLLALPGVRAPMLAGLRLRGGAHPLPWGRSASA